MDHSLTQEKLPSLERQTQSPDVSNMSRSSFLRHQHKLIKIEREEEIDRDSKKTLCQGGSTDGVINRLQISGTFEKYGRPGITFVSDSDTESSLPPHSLRRGDNVSIFAGNSTCREKDRSAYGVVFMVNKMELSITVDEKITFDEHESYSVKHHPSGQTYQRILESLDKMKSPDGNSTHLSEIIFKESPLKEPIIKLPDNLCKFETNVVNMFNKKLDKSQKAAVDFVLRQRDLAVIHGPPGTGKTTTLIEIIRQHVRQGTKVLALAPSNLGVDNLVERLDNVGLKVVRIGHPARTTPETQRHTIDALLHTKDNQQVFDDIAKEMRQVTTDMYKLRDKLSRRPMHKRMNELRKELYGRQEKVTRELVKTSDVVLCTLSSCHKYSILRHVPDDHFGVTVIDECSQGTEASCYAALLKSTKLVLAGDHKQLPPTVLTSSARDLLTSLMERVISLYGSRVVRMLTVQYRMHSDIMDWASTAMYAGQLLAHPSVSSHLLKDLPGIEENEDTVTPLLLIDTSNCAGYEESCELSAVDGTSGSHWNEGEAGLVLGHVTRLLQSGLREEHVAVITPYASQVKLIRSLVCSSHPEVEVQTVDGFQGREKEAVILSLVRSNDKGEIGFLAEDRRLNVAVTRARRHLAVVCNTDTLGHSAFLQTFVEYMCQRARVLRADDTDQDVKKRCVDFSQIDISDILPTANIEAKGSAKTERELNMEREAREKKKRDKYLLILQNFIDSDHRKYKFPCKMSSFDRLLVHEIAETLGLFHYSEGFDEKRRILVSKLPKGRETESDDGSLNSDTEEADNNNAGNSFTRVLTESGNVTTLNQENNFVNSVPEPPSTKHCTLCGKNVPIANFTIHKIACQRKENDAIAQQDQQKAAIKLQSENNSAQEQISVKKKTKKNKKKTTNGDGNDDDDFDSVVSSFATDNKKCAQRGCEGYSEQRLILQVCVWCHSNYCLRHHQAEVHGCGLHAKQHARATVIREGIIYPGSGVPSKLPSADKRAQLQRQLDKKLAAKQQDRKTKPKK